MFSPFFGLLRPTMSMQLIDSNTGQPLDPKASIASSITHTDIKKDGSGKMVMVRHKSQPGSLVNGGGDGDGAPEGNKNNDGKKNGKQNGKAGASDDTKAAETNGDGGKPWTAEDDAKLKELKAENKTWADIANILGRSGKHEVQERFKEIKDQPTGEDGGKKGDAAPAAEASDGGDFTAEEDAKIKELLATNTGYKKIAQELERTLDKALKDRIGKFKDEAGGTKAAPAAEKKQDDAGKGSEDFTAADDAKIKELLDAGKKYNEITKELGRKMGKDFKDHIEEVGNQSGGQDAAADKKENEGGKKNKKKIKRGSNTEKKADKEKPAKDKQEKEKSKEHKHAAKPSSRAGSVVSSHSHRSEAKFTMREWMTLQEDDLFSFGELQLVTQLINKDPGRSWLSVASAFMDKTGRRVHPDDIRDKFDEMARMG